MTVDPALIVAEMRAGDLLAALQSAIDGAPHWRLQAAELLRSIANHELPEPAVAALHEVDTRKRAAELLEDISRAD